MIKTNKDKFINEPLRFDRDQKEKYCIHGQIELYSGNLNDLL